MVRQFCITIYWFVCSGPFSTYWVVAFIILNAMSNGKCFAFLKDIATATYEVNQKNKDKKKAKSKSMLVDQLSANLLMLQCCFDYRISQGISVFIADMLFSLILELLFLVQVRKAGVCPCMHLYSYTKQQGKMNLGVWTV